MIPKDYINEWRDRAPWPRFAHLGVPRVPPGRHAMDFTDVALTALKVVSPVLVAALTWAAAKLAGLIRSKVESEYLRGVHRFETTLPDASNRVWFRLLTGADERKLPQLRRNAGDQLLSAMLAFRVLEVDGVEARDKKKFTENP